MGRVDGPPIDGGIPVEGDRSGARAGIAGRDVALIRTVRGSRKRIEANRDEVHSPRGASHQLVANLIGGADIRSELLIVLVPFPTVGAAGGVFIGATERGPGGIRSV